MTIRGALTAGILLPVLLLTAGRAWAEDAIDARPELITLEVTEKPLDVVLQWISRRVGVNVVTNVEEIPKVTIRLVNVTWQEAVQQIARRYDFVIEQRSERIWELTRPPKVRMEFQNALLTVILDALARQAGVNIVISDRIDAGRRLTMKLNGVPWREALDVIVKTTGYVWIEQEYDIIRIVSPQDVQLDMQTRLYRLNYTTGSDAAAFIAVALSEQGQVVHDERTNSLIITDTPVNLDAAFEILDQIDRRTQEVQIEIKFVEFSTSDALNWGFSGAASFTIEDFGTLATDFFPFTVGANKLVSEPRSSQLVSGNLSFEALSTLSSTEIIQTPSILTLNNRPAEIDIQDERSFAEVSVTTENGETVRSISEAESSPVTSGISIGVTPHITNDGFVQMELVASQSDATLVEVSAGAESIQLPERQEKSVQTNIMVADGETAVIGGILSNRVEESEQRVPVLGSIPLLGYLFRSNNDRVAQRNLTIFITPRVVQMGERDDLEEAKIRLRERLSGLDLEPDRAQPGDLGP